jgi:hypothetical protein
VVGFEDFGYEVIKKGGEALRCHLMRGMEEAPAALCFDFIPKLEVDGRRRAERRQARERRLGQRKEMTGPSWVGVGRELGQFGLLGRSGPSRSHGQVSW